MLLSLEALIILCLLAFIVGLLTGVRLMRPVILK
jgi:hypothetical protein